MRRSMLVSSVAAALSLACVGVSPAGAADRFEFGAGGGFTNPCNGDPVSYSVQGMGVGVQAPGAFTVKMHGAGFGSDGLTGKTYDVTFDLVGTNALDGSASFTGHAMIVFVGKTSATTFVVHSVANGNFRPDKPVYVGIQDATCAAVGKTPF